MSKFIIVDQSLCNLQGHHYECSVSVAQAALKLGYQPIIIANKVFTKDLYPDNIEVISIFEVDWFNNSTIENTLPFWQKSLHQITNFFSDLSFEKIRLDLSEKINYKLLEISLKNSKSQLLIEKIKGSTFRLANWFKKDLELLENIPFANTAWGLLKIVFGLVRFIIKILSKIASKIWFKLFNFQPKTFIFSLQKAFKKIKILPEDHVFIHTLGIEQLEELLYYLEALECQSIPNYHIMLRRDIEDNLVTEAKGIGLKACLHRFYDSKLAHNKVQFYTDTQELIERHNSLSSVQFQKIPVPFRQEKLPNKTKLRQQNQPIHIVYLGDARREKGYHFLPEIVDSLWKDYIATNKIKFTIQSNLSVSGGEIGILTARLELENYPEDKVKLIKHPLKDDSYYQLLADADLLIIPYDNQSYRYRTSGVFTEALAAGKPVIVPANTWLAKQVDESRAKVYFSSKEIKANVVEIVKNLDKYTQSAQEFSKGWQQKHSPDALINCLLTKANFNVISKSKKKEIKSFEETLKVLYIADGDNLIEKNIKGLISLSHLEYLSKSGYQVYLIVYGLNPKFRKEGFENFTNEIKTIIKSYTLAQNWVPNYNYSISFLGNLSKNKYVRQVYKQEWSLSRSLIDINSLELPNSLAEYLQGEKLDILFIDNIASSILVNRLGLTNLPLIYQLSNLYAYEYALKNNQDIDEEEFQLECSYLAKTRHILCKEEKQLEKIKPFVTNSSLYLLPPTISLNQEVTLSNQNNLINFIWQNKNNEYEKTINKTCEKVLNKSLSLIPNVSKSKKIAILYPWGDILERKTGASKRVGLLIDYLKVENHQVWLFTAGDKPELFAEKIRYTFYRQESQRLPLIKEVYSHVYNSWLHLQQLKEVGEIKTINSQILAQINQDWRLSMYYQFRFDEDFINWIEQITDWADIVFLEYPFWAKTVSKICQKKQVKLIITAHDAIYKQVEKKSAISQILLTEEISSLQTANHVISVSKEDQQLFAKYGVNNTVIPNPTNLSNVSLNYSQKKFQKILEKHFWIKENYCLFVGSKHFPNIQAVNQIRQIAYQYHQNKVNPFCKFVIVGTCCEEENNDIFTAVGKVEFEDLTILYQQANLIISPMLSGTGSSLKIIEAMAYGKAILGTNIAFRGYPVESKMNCIIEDKIDNYSEIISQLLLNKEKLKKIGENSRKFAAKYDYKNLYKTYSELIYNKSVAI